MPRRTLLRWLPMLPFLPSILKAVDKKERVLEVLRGMEMRFRPLGYRLIREPNQYGWFPEWVGSPSRRILAYWINRTGHLVSYVDMHGVHISVER